jgi:hypothetical protein
MEKGAQLLASPFPFSRGNSAEPTCSASYSLATLAIPQAPIEMDAHAVERPLQRR